MAKGQLRSNKEPRKPKKDAKSKTPSAAKTTAPVLAVKAKKDK